MILAEFTLAIIPSVTAITIVSRNNERREQFLTDLRAQFQDVDFSGVSQDIRDQVEQAVNAADIIIQYARGPSLLLR